MCVYVCYLKDCGKKKKPKFILISTHSPSLTLKITTVSLTSILPATLIYTHTYMPTCIIVKALFDMTAVVFIIKLLSERNAN